MMYLQTMDEKKASMPMQGRRGKRTGKPCPQTGSRSAPVWRTGDTYEFRSGKRRRPARRMLLATCGTAGEEKDSQITGEVKGLLPGNGIQFRTGVGVSGKGGGETERMDTLHSLNLID